MLYCTPADVDVSDDRDAHLARDSAEPGTDYKTAYGTDLRAPGAGRVIGIDHSNDGAEGRRLTFLMDNGEVIDWIHLASISARVNQRIEWGQTGLALSGGSGFGKDRHYASHLHVTRRARVGLPYRQTLDFEAAILTNPGAGGADTEQEFDMDNGTFKALVKQAVIELQGNDGRNLLDSVIQTRSELKDRAKDALWEAAGNDGRNLFDSVIQGRNDLAVLAASVNAGGIDPKALADAIEKAGLASDVADELARRMRA